MFSGFITFVRRLALAAAAIVLLWLGFANVAEINIPWEMAALGLFALIGWVAWVWNKFRSWSEARNERLYPTMVRDVVSPLSRDNLYSNRG